MSDRARKAAEAVVFSLMDRAGIGDELAQVDSDTMEEIYDDLSEIIWREMEQEKKDGGR